MADYAKANLRNMKIFAWNKYMKAVPGTVESNYWYDLFELFSENYDYM